MQTAADIMLILLLCVQDVIEIMREGMFDRAPLSGLAGGVPVLDFRKAPGSRGGKAGEAARFVAALKVMGSQQNRDTFSIAELQVTEGEQGEGRREPARGGKSGGVGETAWQTAIMCACVAVRVFCLAGGLSECWASWRASESHLAVFPYGIRMYTATVVCLCGACDVPLLISCCGCGVLRRTSSSRCSSTRETRVHSSTS